MTDPNGKPVRMGRMSSAEFMARRAKAEAWECPECGARLEPCTVADVWPALKCDNPQAAARRCTQCVFGCVTKGDGGPVATAKEGGE